MSGSGRPQNTTTTTGLPAWLEPYARGFIGSYGQAAFGPGFVPGEPGEPIARPPGLNQQVAPFAPEQEAALGGIAGMTPAVQGVADLGAIQTGQTLAGRYLDPATNPWLSRTYETAASDLVNQYLTATAPSIMATAQRGNQFGSSAMQEALALSRYGLGRNLENLATNIYGQNYEQERARQLQTMGLLPQTLPAFYYPQQALMGAGAQRQAQTQTELDAAYANAVGAAEWPFEVLSGYGGAIGQAGLGAGTSQTRARGGGGGLFAK